jgi:hypothetical protein
MGLVYGRAGRLTDKNGGSRPEQSPKLVLRSRQPPLELTKTKAGFQLNIEPVTSPGRHCHFDRTARCRPCLAARLRCQGGRPVLVCLDGLSSVAGYLA